jgi:hypothetical protein
MTPAPASHELTPTKVHDSEAQAHPGLCSQGAPSVPGVRTGASASGMEAWEVPGRESPHVASGQAQGGQLATELGATYASQEGGNCSETWQQSQSKPKFSLT